MMETFTDKKKYEVLGAYVSYVNRKDLELKEEGKFVEKQCKQMLKTIADPFTQGHIHNQLNRLYHGAHANLDHDTDYLQKAREEIEQAIDKCLELNEMKKKEDADHFFHACQIYVKNGLVDKRNDALIRLRKVAPYRAAML